MPHPSHPSQSQLTAPTAEKSFPNKKPKDYNNSYNKMANDSSRSAIGLGIVQIVIGVWFLVLGGLLLFIYLVAPNMYRKKEWQICVAVTSIFVLFISSGSLAIAAAIKKTKALVKATFGFSVLSSVTALSILTLSITGEIIVFLGQIQTRNSF